MHRDLRTFRERSGHPVGIDEREAHPRRPGDELHPVAAADLARHDRDDRLAEPSLGGGTQRLALAPRAELLDPDGWRTPSRYRKDQAFVGELLGGDHLDGAVLGHGGLRLEQWSVDGAAASGAEDAAPTGVVIECVEVESHCRMLPQPASGTGARLLVCSATSGERSSGRGMTSMTSRTGPPSSVTDPGSWSPTRPSRIHVDRRPIVGRLRREGPPL